MATTNNKRNTHSKFYALINQMPNADKGELVWQHSNMLTTSLSEFYEKKPREYRAMVESMQRSVDELNGKKDVAITFEEREKKRLRSAILKRLQLHGVDTTNFNRVNSFMEQKRIAGKRLYEMSIDEMKELIPKLESILLKDLDKRVQVERLMREN